MNADVDVDVDDFSNDALDKTKDGGCLSPWKADGLKMPG